MKTTKTNVNKIQQDFNLPHRIINQISNCPDTGFIRIIGFVGETFLELEKRWYIHAEMILINPTTNKIFLREPVKSKNKDWVITNDYSVLVTDSNGNPVINPSFNPDEEITLENSPYKTALAFNRYSDFKLNRDNPVPLPVIWDVAIANDDAMGYFDNKEVHPELIDIIRTLYNQNNAKAD